MTSTAIALCAGFLRSAEKYAERPALEVNGESWTYSRLHEAAAEIAATLVRLQPAARPQLTAVMAHRSVTAFAGILGALLRGHGYVPINPYFPPDRIATILKRSMCRSLIVGSEALPALGDTLASVDEPLYVYFPDYVDVSALQRRFPTHTFVPRDQFVTASGWSPVAANPSAAAYLLFTSGSTGVPKGVEVSHCNIRRFLDYVTERYAVTEHDRFSQMFELVFDLSLFDMFVAWERGACLCCPSKGDAQMPARYINDAKITVWFSVPSLAVAMAKMRMLRPDAYPGLRLSLFCGEALRHDTAVLWAQAAPNSSVENLYGPTEVTLACTYYEWQAKKSADESRHGNVPIGYPFPGMKCMIADEQLREVAVGVEGELLMSGPQVATGYWQDPDKTASAFVVPPGQTDIFYRTGDLVQQTSAHAPLLYLGRIDHQVKIRGNRIELGEIEATIRAFDGVNEAIAVGWPRSAAGIEGITVFVQVSDIDVTALQNHVAATLPAYMTPRSYEVIDTMPLNQNGKIDRKALLSRLDSRCHQ